MKFLLSLFVLGSICLVNIGCPPVQPEEKKPEVVKNLEEKKEGEGDPILNLEYHRYLKEVVNLLESDSKFKDLIEKASPEDIKSGKIATQLQFVDHNVRTKLDELKRKEIDRLRDLIARRAKLQNVKPSDIKKLLPKHLDHNNVDTFEETDLEHLIKSASNDLEEHDRLRRAEFKDHELDKEYERRKHLEESSKGLDELTKKKAQDEYEKQVEERKHHAKVNHPGSKDQLEEVWDEQDHLDAGAFNPETFFRLHDTDGNNYLDEFEIEALFQIELDKVFNSTAKDFDQAERDEEMARMREHVFTEMDKNKDMVISLEEFIDETKQTDFKDNEDWKGVEDEDQFNEKEFEEYSKKHQQPTPPMQHLDIPESPQTVHH